MNFKKLFNTILFILLGLILTLCTAKTHSQDSAIVNFIKGLKFIEVHKYDEALNVFNGIIAAHPEDAEAYYQRGNIYFETEKYELALADYKKADEFIFKEEKFYYRFGA